MRIESISVRNFKRIRDVDLTPEGNVIFIGGRNAQGKTSLLDALWWALAGRNADVQEPVRQGEKEATVEVNLGDYVVQKKARGAKVDLSVLAPSGAAYKGPQGVLDKIIGGYSFDPLAFTRLKGKAQVDALLEVVDLGFNPNDLAAERKALFDERTGIGQVGKTLRGHRDALGDKVDAPAAELSVGEVVAELETARANNAQVEKIRLASENLDVDLAEADRMIAHWQDQREAIVAAQANVSAELAAHSTVDTAPIEAKLSGVEETNRAVRHNAEVDAAQAKLDEALTDYKVLTDRITAVDETKAAGLAAAKLPVDNLGFDDDGVTLNGVPLSEASNAEKINASVGVMVALNPDLRVGRITDGSLLDADSLGILESLADKHDFQLWVEVVGEQTSDGTRIEFVFEDGKLKNV